MRAMIELSTSAMTSTPGHFREWVGTSDDVEAAPEEPGGELSALICGDLRIIRFFLEGTTYGATLHRETRTTRLQLSSRERRVVCQLVSGQFRKVIAHGLGVGASTVSMDVGAALGKLGLRRWEHLVLLSYLLRGSEPHALRQLSTPDTRVSLASQLDPSLLAHLSPAEREVTLLVIAGNTNARIASLRNASVRTVANQVASAFQKLGAHGRLPLVRALGSGQPVTVGTVGAAPGAEGAGLGPVPLVPG